MIDAAKVVNGKVVIVHRNVDPDEVPAGFVAFEPAENVLAGDHFDGENLSRPQTPKAAAEPQRLPPIAEAIIAGLEAAGVIVGPKAAQVREAVLANWVAAGTP